MLKKYLRYENILLLLLVGLFASFLIFSSYTWGRYLFLLVTSFIFFVYARHNNGKIRLQFGLYHIYIVIFAIYILITAIWAVNPSDSIQMFITIIEILICMSVVYMPLNELSSIDLVLKAIMYSGYLISLYSLFHFGISDIFALIKAGIRLENEYANVNSIGFLAAFAVVIQFYYLLKVKKLTWGFLFLLPTFLMIAVTQSRKAILILLLGVGLQLILNDNGSKDIQKKIVNLILTIAAIVLMIWSLSKFELFSGAWERLEGMLAMITGSNRVDSSIVARDTYIHLGMQQFYRTPIGGIGIGCSHTILKFYLGRDTYLHNNYVELLSGGGILGFLAYYVAYTYTLWGYIKYRNHKNNEYNICLVITLLILLTDYGMVSYNSKATYFYLLLLFLENNKLRNISNDNK